jgi:hypothetical protein
MFDGPSIFADAAHQVRREEERERLEQQRLKREAEREQQRQERMAREAVCRVTRVMLCQH